MINTKKITYERKTCISAMLIQSDLRLTQLAKIDKLYINSASTRLLQRSRIDFIEYKNGIFPKHYHINIIAYDDNSSYNCTSKIAGSKIPKWDCILKYCP